MATAVVLATAGVTLALVLLLAGGGDDGDGAAIQATANVTTTVTGTPFEPVDTDGQAIVDLGRQSVEALPRGEWPALYDEFTQEFRDRCPLSEFVAAGQGDAANLGDRLGEISFKYLIDVNLAGDTSAVIVGALAGDEYAIETAYAQEEGVWKIAPAAGTTGCSGFNRLSG